MGTRPAVLKMLKKAEDLLKADRERGNLLVCVVALRQAWQPWRK